MSTQRLLNRCEDIAPLLLFFACAEVDESEQAQIQAHVDVCPACAQQLAEELAIQSALTSAPHPADQLDGTGALLAQCRSELAEHLDDLAAPPIREHWMPFGWLRRWMALRPVWSAAALVLLGLALGTQAPVWFGANNAGGGPAAMNVLAAPSLTDEELAKMDVAGVNFAPAQDSMPGTLQLQVRTEQPLVFSGNVDDANVRRVLTYVIANGQRFDPGVRLDCLDALRAHSKDNDVRHALLAAARKDENPAVRMKALEALRDSTADDAVREALLDALRHDSNPGVRVEAVNLLVRSLQDDLPKGPEAPTIVRAPGASDAQQGSVEASVARVISELENLQRRDPNRYVRLRSAAALRQIGSGGLQ
jgi:hypothetical protein